MSAVSRGRRASEWPANCPPPERYAIFPGSFDPIHNGHMQMARYARRRFGLQRIYLIPTAYFANRRAAMALSGEWRLRLCRAAVADDPTLQLLGHEIAANSPGYLIETVRTLRRRWGRSGRMAVLLGSDLMAEIGSWKAVDDLARCVHLYIFDRRGSGSATGTGGATEAAGAAEMGGTIDTAPLIEHGFRYTLCDNAPYVMSSSEVRAQITAGGDIGGAVPPAVARLIDRYRLYR